MDRIIGRAELGRLRGPLEVLTTKVVDPVRRARVDRKREQSHIQMVWSGFLHSHETTYAASERRDEDAMRCDSQGAGRPT